MADLNRGDELTGKIVYIHDTDEDESNGIVVRSAGLIGFYPEENMLLDFNESFNVGEYISVKIMDIFPKKTRVGTTPYRCDVIFGSLQSFILEEDIV